MRGANSTPICVGLRQMTTQGRCSPSIQSSKWSGMPSGAATMREAPRGERLRTVQSMTDVPPLKAILPDFRVRWRGTRRFSTALLSILQPHQAASRGASD
jgi:hypothetical protein